ncbi:MAG: HlyD family efflux transporter periplasmic adaptor subunit [Syntrophomonadaceae bacterium]|nr:HlyD family efflux transporter periplasmic adaptor subunit [Syntrophomonadaceae bacterium]
MASKKYLTIILLIVALTAGGAFLMLRGGDAVTLASIEKNSLLTADTVNTSFQGVGGRVVSIEVVEQQDVKAGDVIMNLATTDIDLQISQLEVSIAQQDIKIEQAQLLQVRPEEQEKQRLAVASAQESLNQIQQNFDRYEALYNADAVSQKDYQAAASQLEIARNTLAQQQAQLNKLDALTNTESQTYKYNEDLLFLQKDTLKTQLKALKIQKERMVLKAPVDGKITRLVPKVGELVSPGVPAAIIQSHNLYYSMYVDEIQTVKFRKGDKVTGYVPALQENITGTVRSISSAPQYASLRMSRDKGLSDTSSYLIIVDVDASSKLLPGMTVEVAIDESNS